MKSATMKFFKKMDAGVTALKKATTKDPKADHVVASDGATPAVIDEVAVEATPEVETDRVYIWEVDTDEGWAPWTPGVPFVGATNESVSFSNRGFPMEATFHSADGGMQLNLKTNRQRQLRRIGAELGTDQIFIWEIESDDGFVPWTPGVPFVGAPDETMSFSSRGFSMEATFRSANVGVQVNMETKKERQLRRAAGQILDSHEFVLNTFDAPTFCNCCAAFLWGVQDQGCRCRACSQARCTACSEKDDVNHEGCVTRTVSVAAGGAVFVPSPTCVAGSEAGVAAPSSSTDPVAAVVALPTVAAAAPPAGVGAIATPSRGVVATATPMVVAQGILPVAVATAAVAPGSSKDPAAAVVALLAATSVAPPAGVGAIDTQVVVATATPMVNAPGILPATPIFGPFTNG